MMPATAFDRAALWRYRARLQRALDGDTAQLLVDTGFGGRHQVNVRIADLYAPELRDPGGMTARDQLESALTGLGLVLEWPLRLISQQRETVVGEVRSFERYVGTILVCQMDGSLRDVREILSADD